MLFHRPTDTNEHVDRGFALSTLDVVHIFPRNARLGRELLLRQLSGKPCFAKFVGKHALDASR